MRKKLLTLTACSSVFLFGCDSSAFNNAVETASATFEGGVVSEEARSRSILASNYDVTFGSDDSPAARLDFDLKLSEQHYKDVELGVEYCNTLPDTAKIDACIATVGTSEIVDEDEEVTDRGLGVISKRSIDIPLTKTPADCQYIWSSNSSSTKMTRYIFATKYQLWVTTKTFLGGVNNPDSCDRIPYKVTSLQHQAQAFGDYCSGSYGSGSYREFCRQPDDDLRLTIGKTERSYVDRIESYRGFTKAIQYAYPGCRLTQALIKNTHNDMRFTWNGRGGYTGISTKVKSHRCKGLYSDYRWWF